MSEQQSGTPGTDDRAPKVEAVQAVVDRVTSWQDGAPAETVRSELLKALGEAGVEVPASFVDAVVERVRENTEHFDVEPLLTAAESER
jgi:hypothetical protein